MIYTQNVFYAFWLSMSFKKKKKSDYTTHVKDNVWFDIVSLNSLAEMKNAFKSLSTVLNLPNLIQANWFDFSLNILIVIEGQESVICSDCCFGLLGSFFFNL